MPVPRASQSVLLGALAVFLAPPVSGFGGLNYLRTSTKSFGINPAMDGPSYYFLPKIGHEDDDEVDPRTIMDPSPPPSPRAPPPPPGGDECCIVYPKALCRGCIGYGLSLIHI